jgi:superfamily II DNA helicase RecQ
MATTSETAYNKHFDKAIKQVCSIFGITALYVKQEEALKCFFSNRDVFVNLPTCYGKSLIFQAILIMADIIQIISSKEY